MANLVHIGYHFFDAYRLFLVFANLFCFDWTFFWTTNLAGYFVTLWKKMAICKSILVHCNIPRGSAGGSLYSWTY